MNARKLIKLFIPKALFKKIEPFGHLMEAVLFNVINLFPFRGLKVIGVTGTNGKTTTSLMIHRMLQDSGYKCGLMTTVSYGVGEDIRPQMHHMTTVSVPLLISRVKEMKKQSIDYLILETTSHALAQNRVWGVPFYAVVLTNLTHEHIAYHGSFEKYQEAKLKLFKLANKNKKGLQIGLVNADDPSFKLFSAHIANPISYGIKEGQIRASEINLSSDGSDFKITYGDRSFKVHCNIPGSFNVYNSLAASGVGMALKLTDEQIANGIKNLTSVEGRMTKIKEAKDFDLIVDYAHSPDSFEKLFKDLKPIVKGRLIVMFGSLGGGDLDKRYLQGKLAGQFADVVILCEEDDRKENGDKIIEDIAKGVKDAHKLPDNNLIKIHDREEAIQHAVNIAQKGDTVLLLGKGHEKTIEHGDGEHPWDEIKQARLALKNRSK